MQIKKGASALGFQWLMEGWTTCIFPLWSWIPGDFTCASSSPVPTVYGQVFTWCMLPCTVNPSRLGPLLIVIHAALVQH